jgi:YegS/Rv2252/BmrU family lipid kinase
VLPRRCTCEPSIPDYQNAYLIYNPGAGKLRPDPDAFVSRVSAQLRIEGVQVTAVSSRGPGTMGTVARECVDLGADLILVCGGDGTVNEVAGGMVGTSVPLAFLPAGTANVLACELGFRSDIDRVIRSLKRSTRRPISAGSMRTSTGVSRHFLLMAGIGLDAHIVYNMSPDLKNRLGKVAYWLGGFSQLTRRLDEFDVELDQRTYRASFALFSKVRNYGGDLEIARHVTLLDDEFEVVLFEGPYSHRYLKYFVGVATNTLARMEGVRVIRARSAKLTPVGSGPVFVQVDGEYAGELPGTVELLPNALTLLIPPEYEQKHGCNGSAS